MSELENLCVERIKGIDTKNYLKYVMGVKIMVNALQIIRICELMQSNRIILMGFLYNLNTVTTG